MKSTFLLLISIFALFFFLKSHLMAAANLSSEKAANFFAHQDQKESKYSTLKLVTGYEVPDNTIPGRQRYFFAWLNHYRLFYLQYKTPQINYQTYGLFKVWQITGPSSFLQLLSLEPGLYLEVQQINLGYFRFEKKIWQASFKVSFSGTNWLLILERFGLADLFLKKNIVNSETIMTKFYRFNCGFFFKDTAVYLYAKIYDANQGYGNHNWGVRFFYDLGKNFSLFTGYEVKAQREIIGFKIHNKAWSIGYSYKTGRFNIYSHQVEISYQLVSQKNQEEKELTIQKKVNGYTRRHPANKFKPFVKKTSKSGWKPNFFHYKKRPVKKQKISLSALLRKGISPARALKIFRLWSKGNKLKRITIILDATKEEQRILNEFKG